MAGVVYDSNGNPVGAGPGGSVTSVNSKTGVVLLTKSDIGLGNVTNDAQIAASALDTDSTFAANSDAKVPSQKAVKTALDLKQNALGYTAENVANKDTDYTFASNSDTKYPSQKAVKTALDGKQNALGFTPEDVANKDTDSTFAANSDTKYPSQKAVKTALDGKQNALGFTPENVSNKDTDATFASNSDTKYPSQKAVKTALDGKQNTLGFTPEDSANKDTDSTFAANSDTKYPSQKAVKTALGNYVAKTDVGAASGVAGLDAGGKVPVSQLPNSIMEYQGIWNASTNSPSLVDGTGNTGDVYRVNVAGSRNLGSGTATYDVGDYVIYNTSGVWEKADTTDAVSSVAGRTGAVTLTSSDVGLGNVTNDAQLKASALDTDSTFAANSDAKVPSQKAVKTALDTKQASLGYTAENVANKDTDSTFAANSDTKYPSQKAVKTALDAKQNALGYTAEDSANKDTDSTFAANSDTKYPSQKAVKTALALKAPLDSPTFQGTPAAPTASLGNSSTQLATTAFVANAGTVQEVRSAHSSSSITISNPGTAFIGGVTLASGELTLLFGQSTGSQNGPWVFNGSAAALTRPTWWANAASRTSVPLIYAREGTHADKVFACTTNGTITVDTTTTAFSAIAVPGAIGSGGGTVVGSAFTIDSTSWFTMQGRLTVTPTQVTGNSTLDNSSNYRQSYTGAGGHTITLTGAQTGARSVLIENQGTGNLTVSRSGSDTISYQGVTGQTSIVLVPGQAVEFVTATTNAAVWWGFDRGIATGVITSTHIADGTIVNADINAAAAIALSKLATDPLARANHTGTQTLSTISDAGTAAAAALDTDITLTANSDTKVPSQKAIKSYVDGKTFSLGYTAENVANKDIDSTFAANSDTKYPSQKAVKTALDGKQNSLGYTAENSANKDIDSTFAANSDTKYPSQKAVKTALDAKQNALGYTAEDSANKDTDSTFAANSDTKYPSQKAVKTALGNYVAKTDVGAASGVAGLDANGKVPVAQLPNSIMEYQGVWNATTNSPSLIDGTGNTGDVYRVSVAGSRNLGSGTATFDIGDYVIYNTSGVWEKADTTDAVSSVAGRTGEVTLTSTDVGLGNVQNATQIPLSYLDTDSTFAANSDAKVPSQKAVKDALAAKANLVSPLFTGTPAAPTPALNSVSTQIATTEFVASQGYLKSTTAASTYQPLDADLTTIGNLAPVSLDLLQYRTGSWINRTPAQVKTDLALTSTDVGLGNVQNATQLPLSYLDTDATLTANSDVKVPSQKAVKSYIGSQSYLTTTTAASTYQPLDADLTTIGNLAPASLDLLQYRTGSWINRTPAQVKTDLALNNVQNATQMPLSYLDTDNTLFANSDTKVPSQKALKTYIDSVTTVSVTIIDAGDASANYVLKPSIDGAIADFTFLTSYNVNGGGA